MRVLQSRCQPNLALKARSGDVNGEIGMQNLHHDPSTESGVFGDEDARHSPAADLALDGIVGERRSQLLAQVRHQPLLLEARMG
jgi:hypothetical protein